MGIETILRIAPHRTGAAFPAAGRVTAYTAAPVTDNVCNGAGGFDAAFPMGCYITWIAETDCYLHFYGTDEAPGTPSSVNSLFLPAGVYVDWWHRAKLESKVTVVQKTAAGNLYRWPSSP